MRAATPPDESKLTPQAEREIVNVLPPETAGGRLPRSRERFPFPASR